MPSGAANLVTLIQQLRSLSPDERQRVISAAQQPTAHEILGEKLRQAGLVSHALRQSCERFRPDPEPVLVDGTPLSQVVVQERR